jgi:ADP-dependent NAD(P)H-hydrate dehydratase / NAD(P)H-hydrate epimerase
MKLLSPERMATYDRYAIDSWGIPSAVLMENAGRGLYRLMKERYLGGKTRVTVVCGKGNNGGDGFVIARYAFRDGYRTRVLLLGSREELKGDAALNMRLFHAIGGEIIEVGDDIGGVRMVLLHSDVVVDAIFGTGLSKDVEGRDLAVIEEMNGCGKTVIAVDIPSGIDGRSGSPLGAAVKADHTYTFAYPKLGHFLQPGTLNRGRLTVIDISIPQVAESHLGYDGEVVDGDLMRTFLKTRIPWAHKGSYGHLAVLAGSVGKTGAAHMSSLAALKIGAGLVTLLVPASLNGIMEVKLTEVMTHPVEDEGRGYFPLSKADEIIDFLVDKDALIIGPGLSQQRETMELVRRVYQAWKKPVIVDADGINAFQGHRDMIKAAGHYAVFTPHPGELARLIDSSPAAVNADRIGTAQRYVEEFGVNLVLKGSPTIIMSADGNMYVNPTGNPALAKGGSGDILTGFAGGLVSQAYSPIQSALLATYLHGYIADRWVEDKGTEMDFLAGDLLLGLGTALKEVKDGAERLYFEKSL